MRLDVFTNVSSSFPATLEHFFVNLPSVRFGIGHTVLDSESIWILGVRRARLDLVHDRKVSFHGFAECRPGTESDDESALVDDAADRMFLDDDSMLYFAIKTFLKYTNPESFVAENNFEDKIESIIAFLYKIAGSLRDRYRKDVCPFGLWQPLLKYLASQITYRQAHLEIIGRDESFFSYLLGFEHNFDIYYDGKDRGSNGRRRRLGDYAELECKQQDTHDSDDDGDSTTSWKCFESDYDTYAFRFCRSSSGAWRTWATQLDADTETYKIKGADILPISVNLNYTKSGDAVILQTKLAAAALNLHYSFQKPNAFASATILDFNGSEWLQLYGEAHTNNASGLVRWRGNELLKASISAPLYGSNEAETTVDGELLLFDRSLNASASVVYAKALDEMILRAVMNDYVVLAQRRGEAE